MSDRKPKGGVAVERMCGTQAHYSRLFGEKFPGHDRDKLICLANQMQAPVGTANDLRSFNSGLLYFGQFIDHDITRDRTGLEANPYPEPKNTPNMRSPRLDLDSLYGDGPGGKKCDTFEELGCAVYDSSKNAERFVLTPGDPTGAEDLLRDSKFNPLIAEPRNDENLIISQLHILFMKFHNRVVELLEDPQVDFPAYGAGTIFKRARRFVTWHYQWLVWEVFLRRILHPIVLSDLTAIGSRPKLFDAKKGELVALPVEFTMAAFRFGHSMIRDTYKLNKRPALDLPQVLNRVARRLAPENVIMWTRFFGPGNSTNAAQPIDRTIARGLYGLSDRIVTLFRGPGKAMELSLPARTLIRGSKVGLPSGQEACKRAKLPIIAFSPTDRDYDLLNACKMLTKTPLWYYLLYEAEMTGTDSAGHGSLFLGPLGSRIVAEVFRAILKSDKNSYIYHDWEPPAFSVTPGGPQQVINSLNNLAAFANRVS